MLAIITGHLGKDPVTKKFKSGNTVTKFNVATKQNGATIWTQIEAWNGLGQIIQNHLTTGAFVSIQAEPKVIVTEDENGNKIGRPRAWKTQDGEAQTQLEFTAIKIDF